VTIRFRLFATYLGLITFGTGLLAAVVLWSFERFFLTTTQSDLAARAAAVSESVGDWLQQGDRERVGVVVKRYGAQEGIALYVLDPDGALIATSQGERWEWELDWTKVPGVAAALRGDRSGGRSPGLHADDTRLYEAVPVVRNGKLLGVVRMSRTLAQLQAHTRTTVVTVLAALFLILAASAVLSAWLARGLAQPISRMRNFAVELGRGNFASRLESKRRDELGELAVELNRMAERLAELERERRAFLANASHELRTPVSNVHVTLQALESGAAEDPDLRSRFLSTALDETHRMKRLVQDLLDLGRLEAGVTNLERTRLPLRSVIERSTRAVEGRALAHKVALAVQVEDAAHVSVDNERMAQALLNLLDNALKAAPSGSTIHVAGRTRDEHAEITVRDEGAGIAPEHLPHLFEQFYTADRSRRRGGTGLGLAIAKRIIEAHGGSISATSPPGAGATFTVLLPISAPAAAAPPESREAPREDSHPRATA
jgi:signal transduction histidine kinase